ncbi:unannotated protein [freshwater metagenome]|uniref:Unannotated protein n=1 Tax=freshwater metagenome TaxID=449393 RepID=A0A6J7JJQ8_9ZZZZ
MHRARLDPRRQLVRVAQVLRPDAGGEAVDGVVGLAGQLVHVLERHGDDDGPEDLLADDARVVRGVDEDGRLHEVAGAVDRVAAGDGAGAGVAADLEVARDAVELLGRDERAHLGVGLQAVADLDAVGRGGDALDDLVEQVVLDVEARAGGADLALVEEDAVRRAGDGRRDVGVAQDDVRALAAELERHALEVRAAGRLGDELADLGRAGEGDLVDVVVLGQRRAGVAEARDHVQDSGGHAGLEGQLAEADRRQGRLLGRLEDDRAARGERGPDLPGGHEQREVPRDDLRDDADGLLRRVRVELLARQVGERRADRGAAELRGPAAHVPEVVGGEGDVGGGGDGLRLAVVEGVELGELLHVLHDEVAEAVDDPAALGRRHRLPGAVERLAGGADGAVDVLLLAVGDGGQDLARAGVDGLERRAVGGVDVLAVDDELLRPGEELAGVGGGDADGGHGCSRCSGIGDACASPGSVDRPYARARCRHVASGERLRATFCASVRDVAAGVARGRCGADRPRDK